MLHSLQWKRRCGHAPSGGLFARLTARCHCSCTCYSKQNKALIFPSKTIWIEIFRKEKVIKQKRCHANRYQRRRQRFGISVTVAVGIFWQKIVNSIHAATPMNPHRQRHTHSCVTKNSQQINCRKSQSPTICGQSIQTN